jgi:hypothetical protein
VALDGRLGRVGLLAPEHRDLGPRLAGGGVDRGQRDERVLVGDIAKVERQAGQRAVPEHLVDLEEREAGLGHLDVLGREPRLAQRPEGEGEVIGVPHERDLDAVFPGRDPLQRRAAEEVVVELDGAAVADVVRRDVVVGDVGGVHAAAQGPERGCVQPAPVPVRLRAEDRRDGGRDPTRLQVRRGVGLGPRPHQAELRPGLEDGGQHVVTLGPRAEQLEPGLAGHAVPQRPHAAGRDGELGHLEELDVRQVLAGQLRDERSRRRALQFVAVQLRRP